MLSTCETSDRRIRKRMCSLNIKIFEIIQNGRYGYKITQEVRKALEVSESTLYPVLRRLQKDDCLTTFDMQYDGRNRRYYKITDRGTVQLEMYKQEWKVYSQKISEMFEGGVMS